MMHITATGQADSPESDEVQPSASSTSPAEQPKINPGNGFASAGLRTVDTGADGTLEKRESIVRANPLKTGTDMDADGTDANHGSRSGPKEAGWRGTL